MGLDKKTYGRKANETQLQQQNVSKVFQKNCNTGLQPLQELGTLSLSEREAERKPSNKDRKGRWER